VAVRAREELVWELASRGKTCRSIAVSVEQAGLGRMSHQAVSAMLRRLEDRFLAEQQERIKVYKGKQTASLLLIFGEAMAAWEKSKRPAKVRKVKSTIVKGLGPGGMDVDLPSDEITRTTKWRDGDPQHLGKAMEALDRVRKIWGLDAAPEDLLSAIASGSIRPQSAEKALMAADASEDAGDS
jgi:hypothetical protein